MSYTPPAPISPVYSDNVDSLIQVLLKNINGVGMSISELKTKQNIFTPTMFEILEKSKSIGNIQSDWAETNPLNDSYIFNKPTLAVVATSGDYNDLINQPVFIPAGSNGNVQFNDSGAFGGTDNLFWDITTNRLGVGISSPRCTFHTNLGSTGDMDFPYESGVLEVNGDAKWGIYTSYPVMNTSIGTAVTFGFTKALNSNGRYSGMDLQYVASGPNQENSYLRTNYIERDSSGVVVYSVQNLYRVFADGTFSIHPMQQGTYIDSAGIVIGAITKDDSSVLELVSTTRGFLPSRMTEYDRDNMPAYPADGLMIYCTDCIANNSNAGVTQTWQDSTASWINHF